MEKKRSLNWCQEDKDILRHLVSDSATILENKNNSTNVNMQKVKEWRNVTDKLNEITNKNWTSTQVKTAWKRMKLKAKNNMSGYRRSLQQTGGGEKPPSPTAEDEAIMAITPLDFEIGSNPFDSDAASTVHIEIANVEITEVTPGLDENIVELNEPKPSASAPDFNNITEVMPGLDENIVELNEPTPSASAPDSNNEPGRKTKKGKSSILDTRMDIIQSNKDYKKRLLEMEEEHHNYKIKLTKLKIEKVQLEIELLKKNTCKCNEMQNQ